MGVFSETVASTVTEFHEVVEDVAKDENDSRLSREGHGRHGQRPCGRGGLDVHVHLRLGHERTPPVWFPSRIFVQEPQCQICGRDIQSRTPLQGNWRTRLSDSRSSGVVFHEVAVAADIKERRKRKNKCDAAPPVTHGVRA